MLEKYLSPALISLAILLSFSTLFLTNPRVAKSAATHVVISEVQIGQSGTGNAGHDFIELYNPTDLDIDLNGFKLVKRTTGSATDTAIKAWDSEAIVPAKGYYLWASSGWTPATAPDTTTSVTIAADNGIALRQGLENTGTIVDSVAWDEAANAFVENTAFPDDPPLDNSIERKACIGSTSESMIGSEATSGNGHDTDNNANDFVLRSAPDPQNSQSAIETPNCVGITPTATPSPTASPTASPTVTPTATASPTPSATPTISPSPSVSPTATPTATASVSPSPAPTVSPSLTPHPHFHFKRFSCRVSYKSFRFGYFILKLPMLFCGPF